MQINESMLSSVIDSSQFHDEELMEHDDYEIEEENKTSAFPASSALDRYEESVDSFDDLREKIRRLSLSIDHLFIEDIETISSQFRALYLNTLVLEKNGLNPDVCSNFKSQLQWLLNYLINRSAIFSLRDHNRTHVLAISRLNKIITDLHEMIVEKDNALSNTTDKVDIESALRFHKSNASNYEQGIHGKDKRCCRRSSSKKRMALSICLLLALCLILALFILAGKN